MVNNKTDMELREEYEEVEVKEEKYGDGEE